MKKSEYVSVKLTPTQVGKLMKKVNSTIVWMEGQVIEESKIRDWLDMFNSLESAARENGTPINVPKKR